MTQKRKITLVLVIALLCGIVIGIVLATRSNDDETPSYDVSIRVAHRGYENNQPVSHLEDLYFPFYEDEIHIEREYDGKGYGFEVTGIAFGGSSKWMKPSDATPFVYRTIFDRIDSVEDEPKLVCACERGEYVYSIYTETRTNTLNGKKITFKGRIIKLYLTIK